MGAGAVFRKLRYFTRLWRAAGAPWAWHDLLLPPWREVRGIDGRTLSGRVMRRWVNDRPQYRALVSLGYEQTTDDGDR